MGTPKLTTFMIALVVGSFFIVAIQLYIGGFATNYGVSFDESTLDKYNKLEDLTSNTEAIQNQTQSLTSTSNAFDIVGEYFSGAYQATKTAFLSFDIFFGMMNDGINDLDLGPITNPLILTISAIVLILLVVGVIIAAAVKRDL